MSLSYNSKDFNLQTICQPMVEKFKPYSMSRNYYVYGLRKDKRPHIRLNCRPLCPSGLLMLFAKNQIKVGFKQDTASTISIGLRYDIRKYVAFSRRIIFNVILSYEGKIDWSSSIPTISVEEKLHV